jgi:hypothetical protein
MPLKNIIDSCSERSAAPVPAAQGAEVTGPQPVGDQTQGSTCGPVDRPGPSTGAKPGIAQVWLNTQSLSSRQPATRGHHV